MIALASPLSFDANAGAIESVEGDYANHKMIYQTGVFYAYEACGLGFRKSGKILDNMSKFIGHIVS